MKKMNFRNFMAELESMGELLRIEAEVDPVHEIAAITDRVCKSTDNRGLLFESVKGSPFRAATNLFGSEKRMALSLGLGELSDLTKWFDDVLADLPAGSAAEKLEHLLSADCWHAAKPETCGPPSNLPSQEISLKSLPALKNHPHDGEPDHDGRFLTLPIVITSDPDGSNINCGMYRAAITSDDTMVIKWGSTSGAAMHGASWEMAAKPMPVVITLGAAPALTLAATLPLPPTIDELTFARLLQGEPLQIFSCANGLPAPLDAELVIEGYLSPVSARSGVFGNHTGCYTPSEAAAQVKVTAIRHRSDMILPSTIVGRPPMEDCWLARAGGYLLLSLLKVDMPQVISLHQPLAGIFHGAVIISLKKAEGEDTDLIAAIRKTPWFGAAKLIILVDADQDPTDEQSVFWRIMNCVNADKDIVISATTVSIDATRKAGSPAVVEADADTAPLVGKRWKEYGFAK
ncbi:MAG: UbiD family decarboxylase [Geobacteraceae bacterium]|nr:UbiD family decarboxylase [Geobacteraceae bacterium]